MFNRIWKAILLVLQANLIR